MSCPNAFIGHPFTLSAGFPLKTCGNDTNNKSCHIFLIKKDLSNFSKIIPNTIGSIYESIEESVEVMKPRHDSMLGFFIDFDLNK
ncbi:MAG: hypothetical protein JSW00_07335, partial [Thermoplasmata archaeon]